MTNSLKLILLFGLIAIPATYFAVHQPETQSDDAAYQQQLAALRKKQEAARQKNADSPSSSPANAGVSTETTTKAAANNQVAINPSLAPGQSPSSSPNSNQVTQHIKNTLSSLQSMIPGAKLPVANYDSNAQRLQYLQTMPVAVIESTGKQDAQIMARKDAGRPDPFAALPPSQPFPKAKNKPTSLEKVAGKKSGTEFGTGPDGLPPPPPGATSPSLTADLTPPPPPPGIELDELPPPPEKPMLSKNLKLNAILGDHIILAFKNRNYQKRNHFKQYITLAQGQEFDTVTLVDIGKDEATIEEHGRQITMHLDPIR